MGKLTIDNIDVVEVINDAVDTLGKAAKVGIKFYVVTHLAGFKALTGTALRGSKKLEAQMPKYFEILAKPAEEVTLDDMKASAEAPEDESQDNGEERPRDPRTYPLGSRAPAVSKLS